MKSRCLHRKRGVCPSCRRFERSLSATVKGVTQSDTLWKPGIIAELSRAAKIGYARTA